MDSLLGHVHRVVPELLEVQRHPEGAPELSEPDPVGVVCALGQAPKALVLDEPEEVVDLVVLLGDLAGQA